MADAKTASGEAAQSPSWEELERWDRAYYLHAIQAQSEYTFTGVARDEGSYLYLADGTKLIDFMSQSISDNMGHRHPRIHAEIARAMDNVGHVATGFATEYRARASKLIIEDLLGGEHGWAGRLRILCSGSEAVESALMMARLFTGRQLVLTQAHSFHGWTTGSTGLRCYQGGVSPEDNAEATSGGGSAFSVIAATPSTSTDPSFVTIPVPEFQDWSEPGPLPSVVATEEIIKSVGPENIAAVITEPMFGAGSLMPLDRYHVELRELSKKYGFLWINDEVLTGFGRLGEWFGYQCFPGIEPDLMTIGKGINSCALPVGGVVASHEIAEYFDRARWWTGSTMESHPLVCASIVGCIETMIDEDTLGRVRRLGHHLHAGLQSLAVDHPSVGRLHGRGLCYAVDLIDGAGEPIVKDDRSTLLLGDLSQHPNNIVARECAKRGVYLGGFVPNTIKVAPPFTVTEDEIGFALSAFGEALSVIDEQFAG